MLKPIIPLVVTLFVIFSFLKCNKPPQNPASPVVYCAGVKIPSIAMLWKNNSATRIGNGYEIAEALSVNVVGNDVYVGGFEGPSVGKEIAKIWKNGVPTSLSDGTRTSYATSVFVSGKDVYAAISDDRHIRYSKNGNIFQIDSSKDFIWGASMYVAGSNIYIVGFKINSNHVITATIWKNGTATYLGDGIKNSFAYSIYFSGNDVYVAGTQYREDVFGKGLPRLWKNGVVVPLSVNSEDSFASSVFVSNQDIYVAGAERSLISENYIAILWKNGNRISLSDGNFNEGTTSLFVSGKDVYVGGWENRILKDSSTTSYGKYWKNGKAFYPAGLTDDTYIYSIFVK